MLFLILVLVLSIPAVQTRLGKYATKKINEKHKTNINIQKVGLQFNGDVELKNIYIEDYKKDTLISIVELNTSIVSFKKLYDNKLTFGDIDIYGMLLNIKTHKGEDQTNLDVFVAKFDSDEKSENQFLMSSSDVSFYESEFRIVDENKEQPLVFALKDLNTNATGFVINGPEVMARINKMSFVDQRGLVLQNMSTNFKYTLSEMTFDFLQIKTEKSELNGNLKFSYDREGLQDFVNKVKIDAEFTNSTVTLEELNKFYDEFGANHTVNFNTVLYGTLNNLTASQVDLRTSGRTKIDGNLNFKNLFSQEENDFVLDADFNELSSTYRDLSSMLPNVLGKALPSAMKELGRFLIQGKSVITAKTVDVDVEINSELGLIFTELSMSKLSHIDDAQYKGNLVMDEFKIGKLINDPNFKTTSLNLEVDGKGFTLDRLNTFVEGKVYGLNYKDYYYSDIDISGNVQDKIFNGKFNTKDDNIELSFNGLMDFTGEEYNYDFVADVTYANLNALNFVKQDSISVFRGIVDMKVKGTSIDNTYGSINFKNTLYKNQDDEYYFKDFAIASRFEDEIRFVEINSPDIIEGEMKGKFRFRDIFKLVQNSVGNIYTNYEPSEINDEQFIDFNFRIYNKIVEVFYPDLELGSNTFIRGHVETDANKFNVTFKSPEINLWDYFARDIQLSIDNSNPLFNTLVEIDSLHTKLYDVGDFSFVNVTRNDTLLVKSEFKGGKQSKDYFDLSMFYTIDEENKSVIGFKKSEVEMKGYSWLINAQNNLTNKVTFEKGFKNLDIDNIKIQHKNEEIVLSGSIQDENNKDISIDFLDVDLAKITPDIEDLELLGNVNGKLNIRQLEGVYIPESNFNIENLKVNDNNLGSFVANIKGNESFTNYDVNVSLTGDSTESLLITGNVDVAGKDSDIDLNVAFDEFILEPLNPFGGGNITNIRGQVNGDARVTGKLNRPEITGELLAEDAGMTIPYLNVDYEFEDDTVVKLENQSFIFEDARLTDSEYFSRARLTGNMSHVNFSKWALDLNINSDRLLVLNTQDSEDAMYYGTAFVDGDIYITGPTDELTIKAEVASEEGTVFIIPLNDTEAFTETSYINFLSTEEKEARLKGVIVEQREVKGLEMDFDLTINKNAEIEIVVDRQSGSSIKGRGYGGLLAQINTNGKFNMYGDFQVIEGVYNFMYGGLIQKEFKVLPGGSLVWEGDPLQAEINIEAIYDNINANPSILLDSPIGRSIPVEVKIHLTERLEKPNIDFDLLFPNVNSTLNSELRYRISDKESREFQALSLLATGAFRGDGSGLGTVDALGLVSDRATALINELISSEDDKVKFGLDVDLAERNPNFETDSRVGVTLSTQLSDRILVNGKVGVPIGGVSETVVAGDVEIEVLLNEDRTLSLKFFNRENDIQNFGEQIGYTQGIGISYNVEFDNLKELFQIIFKGNDKEVKKEEQKKENNTLPEYMSFKSKDSTLARKNRRN